MNKIILPLYNYDNIRVFSIHPLHRAKIRIPISGRKFMNLENDPCPNPLPAKWIRF